MRFSPLPRWLLILMPVAAAAAALWLLPPIAQDPAYHRFADQRGLLGVTNFANVMSNLGFIAVGVAGLWRGVPGGCHGHAWRAFHAGMVLIGIGSGWYHLAPDNAGLMWDRLAMAVGFTSLVALLLADRFGRRAGDLSLWPLLLFGLGSVLYWSVTEQAGRGDLRPYLLAQLLPLLVVPPLLLAAPRGRLANGPLWLMLVLYLLAKGAEFYDAALMQLSGGLSGHSLKHLLGALAAVGPLVAARLSRRGRW